MELQNARLNRMPVVLLTVLFTLYFFSFAHRQLISMLLDTIKEEFSVSDTSMGLLAGPAFAIAYSLAGLPIAYVADRTSYSRTIAIGVVVWMAMSYWSAYAPTFAILASLRAGVGIGQACLTPCAHAILVRHTARPLRGATLGIYSAAPFVGILFGFFVTGHLVQRTDWRTAISILSLAGIAIGFPTAAWVLRIGDGPAEKRRDPPPLSGSWLATTGFPMLLVAAGMHAMCGYSTGTWLPAFYFRVHNLAFSTVGMWLGLSTGIGGVIGVVIGGRLADAVISSRRVSPAVLLPCFVLAAMPLMLVVFLADSAVLSLAAHFGFVIVNSVPISVTYTLLQRLAPEHIRSWSVANLLLAVNILGLGVGPPLVGYASTLLTPSCGVFAIRFALLILLFTHCLAAGGFLLVKHEWREQF